MRPGPPRKRLMQRKSSEKQNPLPKRMTIQEKALQKMEQLKNIEKPFVPYGDIRTLKNLGDLEKKKKG